MQVMTPQPFKEFLFEYFIEWEKRQPNRRSSFSAFARWLSENSYNVTIKQQLLSDWIKGRYKPEDEKYLLVLAEKIGEKIYDVLGLPRPNPYLQRINQLFENLPEERQRQLAEAAERYETENAKQNLQTASKRRKKSQA